MHRRLFMDDGKGGVLSACAAYYGDVRPRLIKDGGNGFGYHFSDEDFYVYFLAHSYKHCSAGGAGLRTLLDVYLYRRARPDMDGAYIAGELEKLGLTAFGRNFLSLSEKLFGPAHGPALTADETVMLDWLESSGVYGTLEHGVQIRLREMQGGDGPVTARTRAKYLFRRVFPDRAWYRANAPFAGRHPWAIPFAWVGRMGRALFVHRHRHMAELAALGRARQNAGEDEL